MRHSLAFVALLASALASPMPASNISPRAPAGCSSSYEGKFILHVVRVANTKRELDLVRRQQDGVLTLTLVNGIVTDQAGRTGYIADNNQFQFDQPPQAGAITAEGFSVCKDGNLALGESTTFYQCHSGDFYNLYNRNVAAQCEPIHLAVLSGPGIPVTQISDGQPQGPTGVAPVTQISDGQPQVPTGQPTVQPPRPPVTQISDGQPQVPLPTSAIPLPSISVPPVDTSVVTIPTTQPPTTQPALPSTSTPLPSLNTTTSSRPSITTPPPSISQQPGVAATPVYGYGALAAALFGAIILV